MKLFLYNPEYNMQHIPNPTSVSPTPYFDIESNCLRGG